MDSRTKNRKTPAEIHAMAARAFPDCSVVEIREPSEGYFNAAYSLRLSDGRDVILKIAPAPGMLLMSYDENVMATEVVAMKLVGKHTDLPVAEVYLYDDSCTLCDSSWFVMECLPGINASSTWGKRTAAESRSLQRLMGQVCRKINAIAGDYFGIPGREDTRSGNWFDAFYRMMELAIQDARRVDAPLIFDSEELLLLLRQQKKAFREVETPRLLHYDLWDGNVFLHDGELSGIIDFERCLWGDPLLEPGFRSYAQDADFLAGYGKLHFTPEEQVRIRWYDIYNVFMVTLERYYRGYEDEHACDWWDEMLPKLLFPEVMQ